MAFLEIYAVALGLTLAIELPAAAFLAPRGQRVRVVGVGLLLNLFTHPMACAAYWEGWASFYTLEALVFLVEGVGYALVAGLDWRRAAGMTVLANSLTAALSYLF